MKDAPKYFIICSMWGGVLGFLVYTIIVSINEYDFSIGHAIISLLLGAVIGIFLVKFLNFKHHQLYANDRFRPWMLLFIEANLFCGIFAGLILGILASWLLVFPFSLLFGHPEGGWLPFVANLFKTLLVVVQLFCIAVSTYYLLKSSILYFEKKTGSSDISKSENGAIRN